MFWKTPSPVYRVRLCDVTWWQRWDFDLGLTVMQKERGVFLGKEPTSGQHPPLRKKGKSPYLGHPIFVRIPTSRFHTVESWIPSTRTVARYLFTRTTIDKPPPPSEKERKKKRSKHGKVCMFFCSPVFLLKSTVPVCTAVRVTFPTRKNT